MIFAIVWGYCGDVLGMFRDDFRVFFGLFSCILRYFKGIFKGGGVGGPQQKDDSRWAHYEHTMIVAGHTSHTTHTLISDF